MAVMPPYCTSLNKKFPKLDRFGDMAGKPNESYLNADLFAKAFLTPCEPVRHAIGLLMFEFSRFWPTDYEHGRDFVADLDKFLGQLRKGWPYGVEMRNRRLEDRRHAVIRLMSRENHEGVGDWVPRRPHQICEASSPCVTNLYAAYPCSPVPPPKTHGRE